MPSAIRELLKDEAQSCPIANSVGVDILPGDTIPRRHIVGTALRRQVWANTNQTFKLRGELILAITGFYRASGLVLAIPMKHCDCEMLGRPVRP
jgi:hypothetical protein